MTTKTLINQVCCDYILHTVLSVQSVIFYHHMQWRLISHITFGLKNQFLSLRCTLLAANTVVLIFTQVIEILTLQLDMKKMLCKIKTFTRHHSATASVAHWMVPRFTGWELLVSTLMVLPVCLGYLQLQLFMCVGITHNACFYHVWTCSSVSLLGVWTQVLGNCVFVSARPPVIYELRKVFNI